MNTVNCFSLHNNTNARSKRCENVVAIVQQVQACPWHPFKLFEIVTLEKCLHEASEENPRIRSILRKLANEGLFVEPTRKLKHLARNDNDKRVDSDLMKRARKMREEIDRLNQRIDYYMSKLNDLSAQEQETKIQISQSRKSSILVEAEIEQSRREFEVLLERVLQSFERSIHTIKFDIPEFIRSITESQLVKQLDSLPGSYKTLWMELAKNGEHYLHKQQLATQFSFSVKKNTATRFRDYLATVLELYRNLALIYRVYSTEIPDEIESLAALDTHIEYLKKPLEEAPKRVIIKTDHVLRPIEQPHVTAAPPESIQDPELGRLFSSVSEQLKVMIDCKKG